MTIYLDHTIVPSRNKVAAAQRLAQLLDVPWAPTGLGPFAPVHINDGLTLDFIDTDENFPVYHFCFRVSAQELETIVGRLKAAGIAYRSTVRGPVDMKVNTTETYSNVYWNEPDGHQWELITARLTTSADLSAL